VLLLTYASCGACLRKIGWFLVILRDARDSIDCRALSEYTNQQKDQHAQLLVGEWHFRPSPGVELWLAREKVLPTGGKIFTPEDTGFHRV